MNIPGNIIYMTQLYAFTYKINRMKAPTEEDYNKYVLKDLRQKYKIIDHIFEKDSKGKLHVHGVIDFGASCPRFTTVVPNGVHAHHVKITDIGGWQRYMLKAQRQQIDNTTYMF